MDEATGKLVRDLIPGIITAAGLTPRLRTAAPAELDGLLRAKLGEEVQEFLDSGEPEELADVLEVLHALAARQGLSPDDLERLRAAKAAERGGFTGGIVWFGNEPS
ncbi:hypothetical protein ACIRBX_03465 [Kitasatospora sp. NPDC096147]|uniref:hypothetical protein n=1 Tax=Kitasatospora sp. NPDC096147 TaxID=3364093 RepID=UPI003816C663